MKNVTSFIDSTITDMAQGHSSYNTVAQTIQAMDHKSVLNRIALAWVKLGNDRQLARRANQQPKVKPEVMLSFLQQLMNQICWAGRRLMIAQQQVEAEDQAMGVDFSQDIAAQLGVECVASEHIAEVVDEDFRCLLNVHTWLAAKMEYLEDIESFYCYADRQQDEEGNWQMLHHADRFDDALSIMEQAIQALQEADARVSHAEAGGIDFTLSAGSEQHDLEAARARGNAKQAARRATGELS